MVRAHLLSVLPLLVLPTLAAGQGMPPCTLEEHPEFSMVDLGHCLDSLYTAADADLNAAYRGTLSRLGDRAQRVALVQAERAWIEFRDAEDALRMAFAGGNHPSIETLPDKITMTRARTAFLRGMMESGAVPVESGLPMSPAVPAAVVRPSDEGVLVAAMKADLRNLVTAEESFFADSVRYTTTVGAGGVTFRPSSGNTMPTIWLTPDGWRATIGNRKTPTHCSIFIGHTVLAPATKEGVPACQ